ncbi:MBL fold metallo-hydrolase [Melittangium boletus]|uniref:MBL fold metallo-hydrolase n=1 Tax=Melittangium boletus TaxID=83453 RepID=UPI003DA57C27
MKGLIFEELNGGASCRTYLIACARTREAIIVDPVLERVPSYLQRLGRDRLQLLAAVDTHTHADHLSGGRELARMLGTMYVGAPMAAVERTLRDGEYMNVGDIHVKVWASPGHTADGLVLLLEDRVLTGDTLLIGASGRTDLPSGDPEAAYDSLERLLTLPSHMLVYPAHDYGGRTFSTMGHERVTNPRLRMDRAAFVELLSRPRADKPARLEEALAYNSRPGEALETPALEEAQFLI